MSPQEEIEALKACLRDCIQVIYGEFSPDTERHRQEHVKNGQCCDWCKAYHRACELVGEAP